MKFFICYINPYLYSLQELEKKTEEEEKAKTSKVTIIQIFKVYYLFKKPLSLIKMVIFTLFHKCKQDIQSTTYNSPK